MKQTYLQHTGFYVDVPDNVFYSDDGLVKSLRRHTIDLAKGYGLNAGFRLKDLIKEQQLAIITATNPRALADVEGSRFIAFFKPKYQSIDEAIKANDWVKCHTYVLAGRDSSHITFDRGHEEFHYALNMIGGDSLGNMLHSAGYNCPWFADADIELKCHVGGLIAVARANSISSLTWTADSCSIKMALAGNCWDFYLQK